MTCFEGVIDRFSKINKDIIITRDCNINFLSNTRFSRDFVHPFQPSNLLIITSLHFEHFSSKLKLELPSRTLCNSIRNLGFYACGLNFDILNRHILQSSSNDFHNILPVMVNDLKQVVEYLRPSFEKSFETNSF